MNSLPKTVTKQRRDCNLNPGPSAPESSTLTTRLPRLEVDLLNFCHSSGWCGDSIRSVKETCTIDLQKFFSGKRLGFVFFGLW